ncbi:O-antigen ligase family protein [Mobilicoccus sp.]|uniref:O-antigen ligase family protein n=1 Tax=Mobilicoccus sp. TaxID=2034349 RepID=UPI00289F7763|nr:O-antigen ligase family protein [Mobilicoccus sp.]
MSHPAMPAGTDGREVTAADLATRTRRRAARTPHGIRDRLLRVTEEVPIASVVIITALLLNVFAGRWSKMGIPLGPDRLLFAGGLILLLLDPRIPRPRARALHGALIVFAAWTLGSMILTGADTDSTYAFLDRVVMPFLLFATAPMFLQGRIERLFLLRGLSMLGVYLTFTAVAESAGLHALLFPRYIVAFISDPRMSDASLRANGPFLSGEANGMALALCAVAAFLLARLDRGGWRAAGLLVGPAATAASVLSMTRSVWLGVALAVVTVVWSRRGLWQWIPFLAVAGAAVAVIGLAAVPDIADNIVERGSTSRSLDDRANSNAGAMRAIADDPLTGVGWGRFVRVGPDWVRQAEDYPVTTVNIEVHNVVLSRAAELGIPAALLFTVILLAGPFAAILRRRTDPEAQDWRTATTAATLIWFVPAMTSPIPYPFPTYVFFTFTGLLWAFPCKESDDARRPLSTESDFHEARDTLESQE